MPSIADKMNYEKFYEPRKPSTPLSKTEITDIAFSREWLNKNDKDPLPDTVMITFPTAWLENSPHAGKDNVVNLRIPKELLESNDMSKDPSETTVTLNSNVFIGYSNSSDDFSDYPGILDPPIEYTKGESEEYGTKAINHSHRIAFQKKWENIEKLEGTVTPYSYSNNGETFLSYHEHEFYTNAPGDFVEVISDLRGDNGGTADIWVAIYEDGIWSTPTDWVWVKVNIGQRVDYYIYLYPNLDRYNCWLYDVDNGVWHYQFFNNDGDATQFDWLDASTELDDIGGLSKNFQVITYPLKLTRTYSSKYGMWFSAENSFTYYSIDPFVPYVLSWFTIQNHNILTYHRANYP